MNIHASNTRIRVVALSDGREEGRGSGRDRRELLRRAAVAAIGIPLAFALVWTGGWTLGAAAAVLAAGGAWEIQRLAARSGIRPFTAAGCAAAAAFPLVAAARPALEAAAPLLWCVTLVLLLGAAAAAPWRRGVNGRPLEATAVTLLASLFTGGTLAFVVFLRHLPLPWDFPGGSPALALFPLLLVWASDTAAYAAGHAIGRTRLTSVSPGKTREGALAGFAAGAAAGALYSTLALPAAAGFNAAWGAAAGGLVALAALGGDLAKSAWKRAAGTKDSGRVFPGHGGIVDRFDSTFYALPLIYLLAALLAAASLSAGDGTEIGAAAREAPAGIAAAPADGFAPSRA